MKPADIRMRVLSLGITAAKIVVVVGIIAAGVYNITMFFVNNDIIAVPKNERSMVEFYLDHPEWGDKKIVEYNEMVVGD